jgi:predicted 3-demethylubiquinone-9 3-methyltransferase (glyoxalase superfamily)
MQKITPYFWFDDQALEAANFYVSLFKNSKINEISYRDETEPELIGKVMIVSFTLDGQDFIALNGGPHFKFTEAISLFVDCEDQREVDRLWEALLDGGEALQCGWLKDKYGLTWQIIPSILIKLMNDPDPVKSARVRNTMLKMVKIDIETLQKAYSGTEFNG